MCHCPVSVAASPVGRPDLRQVTLVAVTGISLSATLQALEHSLDQADFGAALLLSDKAPGPNPRIEWRRIDPIRSRAEYSRFMLQQLAAHVETDFALCVQWDGYVLDGSRWRPDFLDYDYIGAPWPHFDDDYRMGNGGFSLRSRKLLTATAKLPYSPGEPEDITICRTHRTWLEKHESIRFAPEAVASDFAFERLPSSGREFGFHGIFNMRELLARPQFIELLASLDPGTIGRTEVKEIAGQSVRRLDFQAAWLALRNQFPLGRD